MQAGRHSSLGLLSAIERALAPFGRVPGPRAVALVCALGLALRLVVSIATHGSNDIDTWQRFANLVLHNGVLRTYELDRNFNHPPLMGWYGALADTFARAHQLRFDFVFKSLPIIASTATVFMVQRIGQLKLVWLLLFAINPTDVLISAYHGNTDSVCVACCVASVCCADRERPWLSGFFLGAAINVKLIPVVLIAPLALSLPPKKLWRFAAALALCALPFVPVMLGPWAAFQRNAIEYNSRTARWGVGLLIFVLDGRLQALAPVLQSVSLSVGKPLIFGSSVLLGLIQLRLRIFTHAELCAIAFGCFLVFAPGFGVQYLVYPTAFLAASVARGGFRYIYLAGACAFLIYYSYWTGSWPAFSRFNRPFDLRSVLVGFLAWISLARYLAHEVRRVRWGVRGLR
jgi:Glycosyltransferase family 87